MQKNIEKIYLVSPKYPSGLSWVINCFLELGIRCYPTFLEEKDQLWNNKSGFYYLNKDGYDFKKWLPSLYKNEYFIFKDNIECEWTHSFPLDKHNNSKIIYFIRDPRDSVYSHYKRVNPDLSFPDFINIPDCNSLLDSIDYWNVFNELWLNNKNLNYFRFEDYKKKPFKTLQSILNFIDFKASNSDIKNAVNESTFEKASKAEELYNKSILNVKSKINRSGETGSYKIFDNKEDVDTIKVIEERTKKLLNFFNYKSNKGKKSNEPDYFTHLKLISSFKSKNIFIEKDNKEQEFSILFFKVLEFLLSINEQSLTKSGLKEWEVIVLLKNIENYLNNWINLKNSNSKSKVKNESNILNLNIKSFLDKDKKNLIEVFSLNEGKKFIDIEDYKNAEKIFTLSLLINDNNPLLLHYLGFTKFKLGNYKESIPIFAESLKKGLVNFENFYYISCSLKEIGDYKMSDIYFKKAHELKSNDI